MWQRLGPLFVCFFHHNEIQNFLLGLWVKAAFSSAQTKEKAHLNSRKNAFCMPTLSWPRFQSWWKNSLKPTTAELLTRNSDDQKKKMTPWGCGGTGAACDAHKGQSVTCHLSISTPWAGGAEVRGDSSLGVEPQKGAEGRATVSSTPGFPRVTVRPLGHPVPFTPSL